MTPVHTPHTLRDPDWVCACHLMRCVATLPDDNWVLKLCDFGESRYDTHQASRGLSGATRPSLPRAVASNPAIRINSFNSRSPAPSKAWRPGSPTRAAASSTFASAPAPPPVVVSMSSQSSLTSGHRALSRVGNPIPSPRPQRRRPVAQGNFKQTPQWAAPEVFTSSKHSTASDVYACASVMYEILAFRPPYYRVDPRRVPKLVTRGVLPRLPDNTAPALAELIYRCWRCVVWCLHAGRRVGWGGALVPARALTLAPHVTSRLCPSPTALTPRSVQLPPKRCRC